MLAGIVLVGAALAYTTVRILRMLQDLYAAQQQVAHDLGRSLQEKLPDTENTEKAVNAAAQDTPAQ